MNKTIVGFGLSLLIACGSEAGAGERCHETDACDEGFECYRGFCIPDDELPQQPVVAASEDAGESVSTPGGHSSTPALDAGTASASPSGEAGTRNGQPASQDASVARDGAASVAQSSSDDQASPPAVTPAPATTSDGSVSPSAPSGPSTNPKPTPAASGPSTPPATKPSPTMTVDAGPSENTDASLVAQDCTLEQCCSEALAAALGSKSEDNKGGKEAKAAGKGCGCDESPLQLLRTLGCTALVPVGALL